MSGRLQPHPHVSRPRPLTQAARMTLALVALILAALAVPGAERRTANNGTVILDGIPEIPRAIVEALTPFGSVRGAVLQGWNEDGSSLYLTTRFGNVAQLHRVEMPGGARHQLTFSGEPVAGAVTRPGRPQLILSMDDGGSEFYQLYAYDAPSGARRLVTDGRSRNDGVIWSHDGHRFAYTSTRRNGRSLDVWIMEDADPETSRVLVEAPDGSRWSASDWSPDGRHLLVVQRVSITESHVHLVELETGERRVLAGGLEAIGQHAAVPPRFHPDGHGIFLATDAGSEFTHLAFQDLATGERRTITGDIPWDVEAFAVARNGNAAAFVVNEDGLSRLYLLNPTTFEHRPVNGLPSGVVSRLAFGPDGARLAFTLNTPRTPSDVFTLTVAEPAAPPVRWTYSEVGGLDAESFVEPHLVRYPTFDRVDGASRTIPAFVYRPSRPGPHPVIIDIHGGPESQYRPTFNSRTQFWIRHLGAAVIAPNVRGSTGYGRTYVQLDNGRLREDAVKDIGALLDWIATQPDLDETRVAVFGGSYGGYMVLASAVHYSDRLSAAAEAVGISNFVTFLENTEAYRRDLRRVEYGDERDPEMRRFLQAISPATHAEKIRVPLFVMQGQNDPRVPASESEQIVAAVRATGGDVWYMNALNEGHGLSRRENADLFGQILALFFERHLVGRR
jgi:dipeptidyl aminopeptidase/acylaminoacyl peptidase